MLILLIFQGDGLSSNLPLDAKTILKHDCKNSNFNFQDPD